LVQLLQITVAFQKHKEFPTKKVDPMLPHDKSAGWKYLFHWSWSGRRTDESTKQWLQGFILLDSQQQLQRLVRVEGGMINLVQIVCQLFLRVGA